MKNSSLFNLTKSEMAGKNDCISCFSEFQQFLLESQNPLPLPRQRVPTNKQFSIIFIFFKKLFKNINSMGHALITAMKPMFKLFKSQTRYFLGQIFWVDFLAPMFWLRFLALIEIETGYINKMKLL